MNLFYQRVHTKYLMLYHYLTVQITHNLHAMQESLMPVKSISILH